jgi:hypothetical protein
MGLRRVRSFDQERCELRIVELDRLAAPSFHHFVRHMNLSSKQRRDEKNSIE